MRRQFLFIACLRAMQRNNNKKQFSFPIIDQKSFSSFIKKWVKKDIRGQQLHTTPGNTKGGSIIIPLTSSCLTGWDKSVLQIKTKLVSCHTADSKPVNQEFSGTVICPPLVFPDAAHRNLIQIQCSRRFVQNLTVKAVAL